MIRRYLRLVAIGLIVLPEPVTTALGLALLSATLAMPGKKRLDKFGDPDELRKWSLKSEEPTGYSLSFAVEKPIVFHRLNQNLSSRVDNRCVEKPASKSHDRMAPQKTKDADLKLPSSPQRPEPTSSYRLDLSAHNWFDNHKVSEQVLHHTLKTSLPQYEAAPDTLLISGCRPHGKNISSDTEIHTLKKNRILHNEN